MESRFDDAKSSDIFIFQIQFLITFTHTSYVIITPCDFPFWGKAVLAVYMIMMFTLFSNFYIQSYIKQKGSARSATSKENGVHKKSSNGVSNGFSNHTLTNGHHEKSN